MSPIQSHPARFRLLSHTPLIRNPRENRSTEQHSSIVISTHHQLTSSPHTVQFGWVSGVIYDGFFAPPPTPIPFKVVFYSSFASVEGSSLCYMLGKNWNKIQNLWKRPSAELCMCVCVGVQYVCGSVFHFPQRKMVGNVGKYGKILNRGSLLVLLLYKNFPKLDGLGGENLCYSESKLHSLVLCVFPLPFFFCCCCCCCTLYFCCWNCCCNERAKEHHGAGFWPRLGWSWRDMQSFLVFLRPLSGFSFAAKEWERNSRESRRPRGGKRARAAI